MVMKWWWGRWLWRWWYKLWSYIHVYTGGVKLRIPAQFPTKKAVKMPINDPVMKIIKNVRQLITITQSPVNIHSLSCNAAFTKKEHLILVCFWQVYFCFLGPQPKLMAQTKPTRKSCKTSDLHRTTEIAIHTCIYIYIYVYMYIYIYKYLQNRHFCQGPNANIFVWRVIALHGTHTTPVKKNLKLKTSHIFSDELKLRMQHSNFCLGWWPILDILSEFEYFWEGISNLGTPVHIDTAL